MVATCSPAGWKASACRVVPSAVIIASLPEDAGELFDPAEDKDFRYPGFYKLPDGIEHI